MIAQLTHHESTLKRSLMAILVVGIVSLSMAASRPGVAAGVASHSPAIHLVSLDPWMGPNTNVVARVRVSGAPTGATVTATLHRAVATRSAFQLSSENKDLPGVLATLPDVAVPKANSTLTVRFTASDGSTDDANASDTTDTTNPVTITSPGVYPLVFAVHEAVGQTLATMVAYVVRLPSSSGDPTSNDGRHPLQVATEVRLQPRPSARPNGELVLPASASAAVNALVDGLQDTPQPVRSSLGFAISPALTDALKQTSSDDGGLADLVDGLPLQPQPWSPLDLAGWLATPGLTNQVPSAVSQGDAALKANLHAPQSSIVDLGAWDGRLSNDALAWFTSRGATWMLVPNNALDDLDTSSFPRTLASPFELRIGTDSTVTALALDEALSLHFAAADPTLGANQLIADLSVIALDLPGIERGMVVAPPAGWTPNAAFLSAYVKALTSAHVTGTDALVTPTSLANLTALPAAHAAGDTSTTGPLLERSLREGSSPAALSSLATQFIHANKLVDALADMSPGGEVHSRALIRRLRQQTQLAAMPDETTTSRTRRFDAVATEVTNVAKSIRLPVRQTITLTSDSASLPLTIRRTKDGPREVLLHIDAPDRLDFPDGRAQKISLTEATTRATIRVHSDSPGDTIIGLTVTSPDGKLTAGNTELVVRSTAASGVGLVISFGSLAFLVIWWGRDIIRSRRRRRRSHIPPAELIDV